MQRVEGSLIRRITVVEGNLNKFNNLEDEMNLMKLDIVRALAPKEPVITTDDVEKWNKSFSRTSEMEALLTQLKKEITLLDGTKIKADILQINKVQNNFINKANLNPLIEDINKLKEEV